jgi:hypothetical protein
MTDNHWSHTKSTGVAAAIADLNTTHTQTDPTVLSVAERQSGTIQPNTAI